MKSVVQAAWLWTVAFGNLIVIIVAESKSENLSQVRFERVQEPRATGNDWKRTKKSPTPPPHQLGPMLGFQKYFRQKIGEKLAFLTRNKAKLCKNLIITFVFEKNANYIAENSQKSQKIVIITSTSGLCQKWIESWTNETSKIVQKRR
jgi:hypothetical protein